MDYYFSCFLVFLVLFYFQLSCIYFACRSTSLVLCSLYLFPLFLLFSFILYTRTCFHFIYSFYLLRLYFVIDSLYIYLSSSMQAFLTYNFPLSYNSQLASLHFTTIPSLFPIVITLSPSSTFLSPRLQRCGFTLGPPLPHAAPGSDQ